MSDMDRKVICDIISEMLDNPDKHGIFPTSTAYTKLELYIERQRAEVLGWTIADACVSLDKGKDPRTAEVPGTFERMVKDLTKVK